MPEVTFYVTIEDALLEYAVVVARSKGQWVFCKHRERSTLEVPGGHREKAESILDAAKRELREETGAVDFTIRPVCAYGVKGKTRVNATGNETFGMLYTAEIHTFTEIHSEIEKLVLSERLATCWTYPSIQPKLIEEARRRGFLAL